MKKIGLLFIGICFLMLTGCGSNETKKIATLDSFEVAATSEGFTVTDNLPSYNGVNYITGSYIASLDDARVEMVIYDTEENAKLAQENQIKAFKTIKSSGATGGSEKGKNYYSYTLISNGYYMVSSRVDNTLVFSKVLLNSKDKVTKIFDSLNY